MTLTHPNTSCPTLVLSSTSDRKNMSGPNDNWTDMLNPITMKLAVTSQITKAMPVFEAVDDAPDGSQAAGQPG